MVSSETCVECPLDTHSDEGSTSCTACGPSQYAPTNSWTCYDCPCADGINCTCSLANGFLWEAQVPVRSSGTPYSVVISFAAGSNTAGCRLMDQVLENPAQSGDSVHYTSTVRVMGSGETGTIKIHAEDQASCEGMNGISVSEPTKTSWGACRETGRDAWRILPTVSAPGRSMLQFVSSHMCAKVGTGSMDMCDEANLDLLIPMDGLAGEVHSWTLSEYGNIEHPCGGVGTHCSSLGLPIEATNTLSNLATVGTVGDAEMMKTFLTGFGLKPYEDTYRYSYWATDAVFKAEECYTASTGCLTVGSEQLYQLEAHSVYCKPGEGLQFFQFKSCSVDGGKGNGFQYSYKCCTIQGIGACEAELTPWAERDETVHGMMSALVRQNISCPSSHVLKGFVLEAKDPGDSHSEIRYDFACCAIAMWAPIAVHTEAQALNGTFDTFDGVYYPLSRSEGRIQMQSAFLYGTQGNSSTYTLDYDKFTGEWCVKGLGAPEDCWVSEADHPLRLGFGGPFDLSSLKPFDPNAGESDNGMKEIKVVKFKKPPRIERVEHADVQMKQRTLNAFEASKELNAFDITTVAAWMPNAPNYRPYCALRDPKAWKSLSEAEEEETEDWGINGRNDLDVLNTEDNLGRTAEAMEPWHPCQRYFHDSSEVNRDAFVSKFDLSRLLTFDTIMSSKLVKHRSGRKPKPPPPEPKWPKKPPRKYSGLSGEMNDAAKGLSPLMGGGMKKQDPSPKGLTPEVLGHCLVRKSAREARLQKDTGKNGIVQAVADMSHMIATGICGFLPKTGVVGAPLGVGAEYETDWALICEKITNNVHAVITDVNGRYVTAREQWKLENDAMDDCSKFTAAQMYKVFCDLHCLEDEVLKGNSAILRSLKGLETHVVKTVSDMLQHYTSEIFEKLVETQTQINHNDGEMSGILTDYVQQMMDQNTEYRDQLSDQMTTQINALSSQLGDYVVTPLNKLQNDIATVNENIITVNDWLRGNEILNPPEPEPELSMLFRKTGKNSTRLGNSSVGLMHTVFHNLQSATAELVRTVHSEDAGDFKGINDEHATQILSDLKHSVSVHRDAANRAMSQRNLTSAHQHAQKAVDAIHRARHAFGAVKEEPIETFARSASLDMLPTLDGLVRQVNTLGNMSFGLVSFASHETAILKQANSFQELSDQAQHFAAADMMVQFESAMARAQRSVSDYMPKAKRHLHARADALIALSEAVSPNSCNSPETLMQVGRSIFEAEVAEAKHVEALTGVWRDTAEALRDVASLLVDGGLLIHYMRLVSNNEVGISAAPVDASTQAPKSIAEAAMFAENRVGLALAQHAGGFAQQVAHAYDMAQMLADMWGQSAMEAPIEELSTLRKGWAGVRQVAQSLQEELGSDTNLRRELLLNHLASTRKQGSRSAKLNHRFPPPATCLQGASGDQRRELTKAATWSMEKGAVFLLGEGGRAWKCDEVSGLVEDTHAEDLPSIGSGDVDALGVEGFLKHLTQ